MEIEFENDEIAQIYQGKVPKGYQPFVVKAFIKAVRLLESSVRIEDLYRFHSLKFEALRGNWQGFFSVRVNDQYRLIFKYRMEDNNTIITLYQLSNHYQ